MSNYEALLFIGRCLTLTRYPERALDIREQIRSGRVNWERVVWVSTSHLVFPALYMNIRRAGLIPDLPADLVEYMEDFTAKNRERNQQIIEQAGEITLLLNQQGIDPVFLKGTAHVLEGLYPDIAERMMGDIDLLVRDQEMVRAADILISAGYGVTNPVDYYYLDQAKHYPRLFLENRVAGVEIHRRFLRYPDSDALSIESVYQDRIKLSQPGSSYILSYQHQMIQNIYHRQIDHTGGYFASLSLRQCYDLFCLAQWAIPVDAIRVFGKYVKRMNNNIAMANYFLGGPACLVFERNSRVSMQLARIKINLKHPRWARFEHVLLFLINRFWLYIKRIAEVVVSRGARRSLIRRLTDPEWYKAHWGLYRAAFRKSDK